MLLPNCFFFAETFTNDTFSNWEESARGKYFNTEKSKPTIIDLEEMSLQTEMSHLVFQYFRLSLLLTVSNFRFKMFVERFVHHKLNFNFAFLETKKKKGKKKKKWSFLKLISQLPARS